MGFAQLAQLRDRLRAGKEQVLSGTKSGNCPEAALVTGCLRPEQPLKGAWENRGDSENQERLSCNNWRAESAITGRAPASIKTSLSTRRPAPDRKGKPCSASPRSGTQASGVVSKKVKVTSGVPNASAPPSRPARHEIGLESTSRPIRISTKPSPVEKT